MDYIKWNDFDETKVSIDMKQLKQGEQKYKFLNAYYEYPSRIFRKLYIETPFFHLTDKYNQNKGYNIDNEYKKFRCYYDNPSTGFDKLIPIIKKFSKIASNNMHKVYMDYQDQQINFLKDYHGFYDLKLRYAKNNPEQIISHIINYNVSKKYPRVEEFNKITIKDLERFLYKGKDVRFILSPYIVVTNPKLCIYTIGFTIEKMEVKFHNATIDSIFEREEIEIKESIKKISI